MSTPVNRQPHIQGLRAVAVLVVVLFHAGLPLPGGFVGVDVFFVISGYVITAMLQRELSSTGRIDFRRFYVRRFKRLTPALALTVATAVLVSTFVLSPLGPQQRVASTAMGAMALGANIVIALTTGGYFDAPAATNPLLNLWSLSVEEQFYLAFPLLMFAAWSWARRHGRHAHVSAVVAVVGIASFALAVHGAQDVTAGAFVSGFYSPFTRAWEFAAGALLALAPAVRWTRGGAAVMSVVGAGLLLTSLVKINGTTPFPGIWTVLPVAATLLLISGAAASTSSNLPRPPQGGDRANVIGLLLSSRPMVRIGDWSYAIYLWHWPLIVFATLLFPNVPNVAVFAAALALLPAIASFRFVEEPIRRRDYAPRGLATLMGVTLLVPLLLAFGVQAAAEHVWKPRVHGVAAVADAKALHAGYILGCHYEPGAGAKDPRPCVWNAGQPGTPVYLLGDSNAAQFEEAIIDATRALQRPFTASTTSGCPLLDIRMDGPDFPGYGASCLQRNHRLRAWMDTVTPGTVILAASDDYWFNPGWSVTLPDGTVTSDRTRMIDAMRDSLGRVVRQLRAHGHRVVLVQTIPHWMGEHAWDPARCTLASALDGCVQRMTSSYATERTSAVRRVIEDVAAATRSDVIEVTAQVCPNGVCVTATSRMAVYRDATHITVAMSHALAPQFEAALGA